MKEIIQEYGEMVSEIVGCIIMIMLCMGMLFSDVSPLHAYVDSYVKLIWG